MFKHYAWPKHNTKYQEVVHLVLSKVMICDNCGHEWCTIEKTSNRLKYCSESCKQLAKRKRGKANVQNDCIIHDEINFCDTRG